MTNSEIEFIKESLLEAISWSDYANDYFKKKHNLQRDMDNVNHSIEILNTYKKEPTDD
ncbi:MAG: hypothetical protein ACTSU7_09315 [Candidatus Heimdallarchaeaceae archaeon]